MTVLDAATPGLRERKRLATRRAIQIAVLDLVSERGLDGVTVDEVSRVADISPRTFFNYFPSKEEAVLGDAPRLPSEQVVEDFVAGADGDLLDGLSRLLVHTGELSLHDPEMHQRRHALLKQYPQLFAMRMVTMRQFEGEVAEVVARRLINDDPALAAEPDTVSNRARLVTLVAFAAMRHAWTRWAAGEPTSELSNRLADSFAELRLMFASERA